MLPDTIMGKTSKDLRITIVLSEESKQHLFNKKMINPEGVVTMSFVDYSNVVKPLQNKVINSTALV